MNINITEGNKKYIKFNNSVQFLKYEVLKRVSEKAFNETLHMEKWNIPKEVVRDLEPNVRCCIYKERAIVEERVRLALGGNKDNPNMLEVIDIACDECPVNKFIVTDACRGCLAKNCLDNCKFGAISFENKKCKIDYSKCKECGKCREACPYHAIAEVKRPCMRSCVPKAISYDVDSKKAVIDNDECIQCGACVINCPFGAIMDKSFIVDVINLLKDKNNKVYAVMAPAIASQFAHAKIGQVISAVRELGFKDVIEASLGADIVTVHEFNEFLERQEDGFMTSSCCPAFVSYVKKKYPMLVDNVSTTVSPMVAIGRLIKSKDPEAKVVFMGPCIAKKVEIQDEDGIDFVLTFEELLALLDSRDINIDSCEDSAFENGSMYGRLFARSGGVADAIRYFAKEKGLEENFKPVVGDGIRECDMKLKVARIKKLNSNFLEGMACNGGCINGPGSINHTIKNGADIEKYGKLSSMPNVEELTKMVEELNIDLSIKGHIK